MINVTTPPSVWVVMPAYNAAQTLEMTYRDLPLATITGVLLVDDGSRDDTVDLARSLGIHVIVHDVNRGYGGNQKTCYTEALARGADIIVMVHPDYQYDARMVTVMAEIIRLGTCDIVLGNRIRTRKETLAGGMPRWKYFVNRSSTLWENFVLGQSLGDFHSGLRAYSREALERIPFDLNTDDFAFDQELLIQASHFGLKLGDVPVPVRYFEEASSINWRRSMRYGFDTLGAMGCLLLHKLRLRRDPRFIARSAPSRLDTEQHIQNNH
jgi:glycosyltransferase involved in cell wall biosynthesis